MRLFLAVWPPDDVVAALRALPRPERPGLRWTDPAQWHVTLRFFGEVDPEPAASVSGAALSRLPRGPVVAELGPAVGRFGQRILHVPVAGLGSLAAAVVGATAGVGRLPDDRPFSGHVTLARQRGRGSLSSLTGAAVSGRWAVEELTLVASVAAGGPGRANRYEVLASYPLPDPVLDRTEVRH